MYRLATTQATSVAPTLILLLNLTVGNMSRDLSLIIKYISPDSTGVLVLFHWIKCMRAQKIAYHFSICDFEIVV